jgi:hypothetical protein
MASQEIATAAIPSPIAGQAWPAPASVIAGCAAVNVNVAGR